MRKFNVVACVVILSQTVVGCNSQDYVGYSDRMIVRHLIDRCVPEREPSLEKKVAFSPIIMIAKVEKIYFDDGISSPGNYCWIKVVPQQALKNKPVTVVKVMYSTYDKPEYPRKIYKSYCGYEEGKKYLFFLNESIRARNKNNDAVLNNRYGNMSLSCQSRIIDNEQTFEEVSKMLKKDR